MNKRDRQRIKNAVLSTLQSYGEPLSLPIKIKAITKSFPNIRLIPYSTQMKRQGISYADMIDYAGTEDAYTDFDAHSGRYIIYYNDVPSGKKNSNRYRWNIAHELGHVVLNHHKDHEDSRIYRSQLSRATYKILEQEADMFAAYILVPHIVLSCIGVNDKFGISETCQISDTAAQYRANDYQDWKKHNRCEVYDFGVLNLYADFVEGKKYSKGVRLWLNAHRACSRCSGRFPVQYSICPVCGEKGERKYIRKVDFMKYKGIDIDDKNRALECPVCHNTELPNDGTYCMICGTSLVNLCTGSEYDRTALCDDPLPNNARFCPHCGSKSAYFVNGFLDAWDADEFLLTEREKEVAGLLPF